MRDMKTFNIKYLLTCSLIFGVSILYSTTSFSFKYKVLQPCIHALTKRLYSPIETEQQMRDTGYSDKYIAGLDHTKENLELADRLRTGSINSHVEEFATLIDVHTNYIEEGIRLHLKDDLDIDSRLQQLELLKSEAKKHLMLKQVTYRWWFFFHLRLVIIVTPWNSYMKKHFYTEELPVELMTDNGIESFWRKTRPDYFLLINSFPEKIIIPTIQYLGIIPINSTYGTGVHLIGLSNQFQTADNQWMSPFAFFRHDLQHAVLISVDQSPIAKRVMRQIRNLQKPQRERIEYLFFEFTHESTYTLNEPLSFKIERINRLSRHKPEDRDTFIRILKRSSWIDYLIYLLSLS